MKFLALEEIKRYRYEALKVLVFSAVDDPVKAALIYKN